MPVATGSAMATVMAVRTAGCLRSSRAITRRILRAGIGRIMRIFAVQAAFYDNGSLLHEVIDTQRTILARRVDMHPARRRIREFLNDIVGMKLYTTNAICEFE